MNTKTVLIVHAHPDPTSLTAQLAGAARSALRAQGHEVIQSDVYAMGWKAVYDERDFPERLDPARLSIAAESGHAFANGTQPDDIAAEQAKLMAADAVIFQFPLWWFSMPAIMKGWIERVYAYGLAYGHKGAGNTHRYGEGGLAGKRAMLSVTTGGPADDYAPRGINGQFDELLFPITHGVLFYPGMEVLPTFAVHGANRLDGAGVEAAKAALAARVQNLFTDAPIPYRAQNGGDYPGRHLLADDVAPGVTGLRAHIER
jgi:NAD(P)H dehydrogenase (quinone)